MRCPNCGGELEVSDYGLRCTECKTEFLQLNGELRPLSKDNISVSRDDNWGPEDGCPVCGCQEMMVEETIREENETYRIWRCYDCGEEARELLMEKNAFGKLMDDLTVKKEIKFDEWIEEELLLEKGIKEPEGNFHAIVEESISETLRQMAKD